MNQTAGPSRPVTSTHTGRHSPETQQRSFLYCLVLLTGNAGDGTYCLLHTKKSLLHQATASAEKELELCSYLGGPSVILFKEIIEGHAAMMLSSQPHGLEKMHGKYFDEGTSQGAGFWA